MSTVRYTLLTDGSSDQALLHVVDWALHRAGRHIEQRHWADLRSSTARPRTLDERVQETVRLYPCDLLFIHRDAEAEPAAVRRHEIEAATRSLAQQVVPIIPVRMTEAWFLHDEAALRRASGNPNGKSALNLPALRHVQQHPDPKQLLFEALLTATEHQGRRRQKTQAKLGHMRYQLAQLIEDYTPLIGVVPSFDSFLSDLDAGLAALHEATR